jgi:hypothetical protein
VTNVTQQNEYQHSPQAWKEEACTVHQDGDDEGVLRLDRLPTAAEGEIIHRVLDIHKRRPAPTNAFSPGAGKSEESGQISADIEVGSTYPNW